MNSERSTIIIPCNPANPVHYLACCGLFDLVSRWDAHAESRWEMRAPVSFAISTHVTEAGLFSVILNSFSNPMCWSYRTMPGLSSGSTGEPVAITVSFALADHDPIRVSLDWWYETADKAGAINEKSAWKMYAGQQTVKKITGDMVAACTAIVSNSAPPASLAALLTVEQGMSGRFGWDPRASRSALDVGYSPNDLGLPVSTYPFTELMAMIGLQSFFPSRTATPPSIGTSRAWHEINEETDAFEYQLWAEPLPIPLARLSACREGQSDGRRLRSIRARRKNYSNLTLSQTC